MLATQRFCPECAAPKATPVFAHTTNAGVSHVPTGVYVCLGGAVVVIIVVLIVMFTTPHASFDGYVNNGGIAEQGTVTSTCITGWDDMVGNFLHNPVPQSAEAQYNNTAGNAACLNVVHGRQHLAIVLVIVAVVLGAAAIALYVRSPATRGSDDR